MNHCLYLSANVAVLFLALSARAEIVTDGSLGPGSALDGPDFVIGAELGQQRGGNLFHSFDAFNIGERESATFSGPARFDNIISRVTGGASHINGALRSAIPDADLYLLNPAGIFFGNNASLDVSGSVHISTADYLRLGDAEGRFAAALSETTVLSVAPPSAFGFMNDSAAPLSLRGTVLATETGKSLSLIGGDVEIGEGAVVAPSGRLNLAGIASPGEVVPAADGLEMKGFSTLGDIKVAGESVLAARNGGEVYIRAEQFVLDHSSIISSTKSGADGGAINIRVNRLDTVGEVRTSDGDETDPDDYSVWIAGSTQNEARGGDVTIQAGGAINLNNTLVMANSGTGDILEDEEDNFTVTPSPDNRHPLGDAGNILITAEELNLSDTIISSDTFGAGQGGNIVLEASGKITLSNVSRVLVDAYERSGPQAGNAGTILLRGDILDVIGDSAISSATAGAGHGGSITLDIKESVLFFDSKILVRSTFVEFIDADTGARTFIPPTGNSGHVLIKAAEVTLDNSDIISATQGTGQGGNVDIHARNSVIFKDLEREQDDENGIFADSASTDADAGNAGEIRIETSRLLLSEDMIISTSTQGGGEANDIHLAVDNLDMEDGALIATASDGSGDAGDITISVRDTLNVQNSAISTEALKAQGGNIALDVGRLAYLQHGDIATNVHGGMGSGGNIELTAPAFTVLNDSDIIAGAAGGDGGNIRIVSEQFMPSASSLIDASSELGIDGNIETTPPDTNIGTKLLVLPDTYLAADKHLATPCRARIVENISTFNLIDSWGVPTFHDDWLRGGSLFRYNEKITSP
ncbi:MAG: filamentous hemagglutinin N-terminal domain-containing protein [Gammaproteobacteria bacterium]|nr:filamentous hemagglutinin N-terminal domain-containing protein [Gammaproteobacteria bacterium]